MPFKYFFKLFYKWFQNIRKDLAPLFAEYPSLETVYLFGSVISGNAGPASDVDIALRFVPELSPDDSFDLRLNLMDALEAYFDRNTDIVVS